MATVDISRTWPLSLVTVTALLGVAIAVWEYSVPLTGVNGSLGALVVLLSSVLLTLDAVMLFFLKSRALRGVMLTLEVLGAVGTFAAAWFLHSWWLMAAMILLMIGIAVELAMKRAVPAERIS